MKKNVFAWILTLILLASLVGCGRQVSRQAMAKGGEIAYEEAVSMDMAAPMVNSAAKEMGTASLPQGRKWIITMDIEAETEEMDAALEAVNAQITTLGGYIESQYISNSTSYRSRRSASLTVRIPAAQADGFVTHVAGIANVTSNSRNVQDITLTYTDTESHVAALKLEEQRLMELMEKAEKMSDLLEIESRLTEVRYQLESRASQLRVFDNQVDYASIHLYITEVQKFTPVEEQTFWQKATDGLAESVDGLCQGILDLALWFIVSLPYFVVIAPLTWAAVAIAKKLHRRKTARKAKKEAAKDAAVSE